MNAARRRRARPPLVLDLQRATHAVGLRVEAELADLQISQGEAHVLAALAGGGAHTVGELQRSLGHRPSTLSGILDRLEGRGLLERSLNPDDRRSLLVALTRRGGAVASRVERAVARVGTRAAARVTPADVAGFLAVTRALAAPDD